jgi:hypothetical protein
VKQRLLVLTLMLVFAASFAITPAHAATDLTGISVQVLNGPAANCAPGTLMANFNVTVNGTPGGSGEFTIHLYLIGIHATVPYSFTHPDSLLGVPIPGASGSQGWYNGTPWTDVGDTPTIRMEALIGDTVYGGADINFDCATNSTTVTTFGFASAAATFQGYPIPSGFVLRTITCDTAVYDVAGGTPVSGAAITAGQTWFVNPTPVTAAGRAWTEVFLAGPHNAFIPASCVSG